MGIGMKGAGVLNAISDLQREKSLLMLREFEISRAIVALQKVIESNLSAPTISERSAGE